MQDNNGCYGQLVVFVISKVIPEDKCHTNEVETMYEEDVKGFVQAFQIGLKMNP